MNIELKKSPPADTIHIVWGAIVILIVTASRFLEGFAGLIPECLFHRISGIPCLTCGGTRSVLALSYFDPITAFRHNPLIMLLATGLILFSLIVVCGFIFKRSLRIVLTEREMRYLRLSALTAIAAGWLYLIVAGR